MFLVAKCGFLWKNYNIFFKKQKFEKLIMVPNNRVGSKQIAICLLVQMINTTKNCYICKWMRRPDSALHPLSICFVEETMFFSHPRGSCTTTHIFIFVTPKHYLPPSFEFLWSWATKKTMPWGKKKGWNHQKQYPYVFSKVYGIHKTFQNKITTS